MQRNDFTSALIIVGLTGSIGMGKSTTANLFRDAGIPVFDSDAMVHRLQARGGEALPLIEAEFHGVVKDGELDRQALGDVVFKSPDKLKRLEGIMFPLLHERRRNFFAHALRSGADMVIVDVPLLFETGGDQAVDFVVVVDAPAEVQRARVLDRDGMTPEKFENILEKQMPNRDKVTRADYIIDTNNGIEAAATQVANVIAAIRDQVQKKNMEIL